MKKTKIFSVFMAGAMLASITACGKEITDGVIKDDSKFQINAFAVENGVGHQWLVEAAIKWNEMNADSKFQVIPQTGSMALHNGLDAMIEAKTTDINMYFGSQRPSLAQITKGLFIDVSDVYQMSVDADGKKIAEKTHYYEDLQEEALAYSRKIGLAPLYIKPLEEAKHIFSHVEWQMIGYSIRVDELEKACKESMLFIHPEEVESKYPIPSAFERYVKYVNIRLGQEKFEDI